MPKFPILLTIRHTTYYILHTIYNPHMFAIYYILIHVKYHMNSEKYLLDSSLHPFESRTVGVIGTARVCREHKHYPSLKTIRTK